MCNGEKKVLVGLLKVIDELDEQANRYFEKPLERCCDFRTKSRLNDYVFRLLDFARYRVNLTDETVNLLEEAVSDLRCVPNGEKDFEWWASKWDPFIVEMRQNIVSEYGRVPYHLGDLPDCEMDCEICEFAVASEDRKFCLDEKMQGIEDGADLVDKWFEDLKEDFNAETFDAEFELDASVSMEEFLKSIRDYFDFAETE